MKVREIHCKRWFLPRNIAAITLYPFIFYNEKSAYYLAAFEELRHHEYTHIEQVNSFGFLKFYFKYIFSSGFKESVEEEARSHAREYRDRHVIEAYNNGS